MNKWMELLLGVNSPAVGPISPGLAASLARRLNLLSCVIMSKPNSQILHSTSHTYLFLSRNVRLERRTLCLDPFENAGSVSGNGCITMKPINFGMSIKLFLQFTVSQE